MVTNVRAVTPVTPAPELDGGHRTVLVQGLYGYLIVAGWEDARENVEKLEVVSCGLRADEQKDRSPKAIATSN